jgi:uncharacterized protein involved in type VI secretion and phage assembly
MSLADLLHPQSTGTSTSLGVSIGIVTSNKDEDGLGRVKVNLPWRGDKEQSFWARIAVTMAGNGIGMVFYPEVGDEVLVAFEQGDINYPYILGALWSKKDLPPEINSDGENNIKMIKTRSGHVIKIDDTKGKEKIEIIDKSEENKISIDSSNKKISIECGGDIELIASKGKVSINAKEIEIKSSSTMNIKGSMVNIN